MDELLSEILNDEAKRAGEDKFIVVQDVWTMSEEWRTELAALVTRASETEKQNLVEKMSEFLRSTKMRQRTAAVYVLGLLEHRARNLIPEIVEARQVWQKRNEAFVVQADVALEVARALPKICSGKELYSVVSPLILNTVQLLIYKNIFCNIITKHHELELSLLAEAVVDFKPDLVTALIPILQSDVLAHRANAAYMLGAIGPDARAAIPSMIESMNAAFSNIEWVVMEALPKIGTMYAVPELIQSLGPSPEEGATSWDSKTQDMHIIACLAALGPTAISAAPHLMPYLGSYVAEKALVEMGFEVVPGMLEYVQSEETRHPWVYSNAAKVIEGIGPQAVRFFNNLLQSVQVKNRRALLAVSNALPATLKVNLTPAGSGIQAHTFNSEIRGYMQKSWALMNRQRYAEAELLQSKALDVLIRYRHMFGGDQITGMCDYIARRLVCEGRLDDALAILDQGDSYWQEYGKGRANYQVVQCKINFKRCQIYRKQNEFSKLESLVVSLLAACDADTSANRFYSVQYYEQSEAEQMLGDCFAERADFEQAEMHYQKAFTGNPYAGDPSTDLLRGYHALLLKTNQTERAEELAAKIAQREKHPRVNFCGHGAIMELQWLEWEPTVDF